jgi:hypothetical protein
MKLKTSFALKDILDLVDEIDLKASQGDKTAQKIIDTAFRKFVMNDEIEQEIERIVNKYPYSDSKELFRSELEYLVLVTMKTNIQT